MNDKFINKQQQIFDTAAELFALKGYQGTSINDLAQAMDLQKGSLYHYFKSKEELLFQLLDQYISSALVEIEEICVLDIPATEKLNRFMLFYSGFYAGDRDRLVLLINEIDKLGKVYRDQVIEKERCYYRALTGIFSQLQDTGIMKPMPPAVAAYAFFGMVHYTCNWFQQDGKITATELGAMFLGIFTDGVFVKNIEAGE
jgi:AcrR family transcriptional regulator